MRRARHMIFTFVGEHTHAHTHTHTHTHTLKHTQRKPCSMHPVLPSHAALTCCPHMLPSRAALTCSPHVLHSRAPLTSSVRPVGAVLMIQLRETSWHVRSPTGCNPGLRQHLARAQACEHDIRCACAHACWCSMHHVDACRLFVRKRMRACTCPRTLACRHSHVAAVMRKTQRHLCCLTY